MGLATNASAFPVHHDAVNNPGLTTLDYFAGQALLGLLTTWRPSEDRDRELVADQAWQMAKAMCERKPEGR